MPEFNHNTTAIEVIEAYKTNLTDYETIVTGGSSGIGVETVRALAKAGARVVIGARDLEKATQIAQDIARTTNAKVEVQKLELDSLESVNQFVKQYLAKDRPLHILINNAGVMACPHSFTKDGIEMQFGTNHLGHFALTIGLFPALKRAFQLTGKKSRVVNLSSTAHVRSDIDFNDIDFKTRLYEPFTSYDQSKTANILFSVGLTKRYSNEGVVSTAVMPGVIQTNLSRHMDTKELENMKKNFTNFKSVEAGASTSVWAAVAPELDGLGGLYLENCSISKCETKEKIIQTRVGYLDYAMNQESSDKLWNLSEQLVRELTK